MVRLIDRLNMTIAADWDIKQQTKQTKSALHFLPCCSVTNLEHIADQDSLNYGKTDVCIIKPGTRQAKMLLTIDKRGTKMARNSFFDCHLSPVWRLMAIEKLCFYNFHLIMERQMDVSSHWVGGN